MNFGIFIINPVTFGLSNELSYTVISALTVAVLGYYAFFKPEAKELLTIIHML